MNTTPETFKIKSLAKDKDALLLIGLSVLLAILLVLGLALLTEAQWERLVSRSHVLWAAGIAAVPTLLAIYARFKLREAAVTALGTAAQPTVHTEQTITTPAGNAPASVTEAEKRGFLG